MNTFFKNTDTVDIRNKDLGITPHGYNDRGLSVAIKHNGRKDLFDTASVMEEVITEALNQAIESGRLVMPKVD